VQRFGATHGLATPPGRAVIDFPNDAAQVRRAFHTEIPRLGAAPAVVGVVSLHDSRPHPLYKMHKPQPLFTESNGDFSVVPADLATIYNLNSVFTAGFSGKGPTIALIENTDLFSATDWTTFRSTFGLSTFTSESLTTVHPAPPVARTIAPLIRIVTKLAARWWKWRAGCCL
jgi:subtilase family serine protease